MLELDSERLAWLERVSLEKGSHGSVAEGVCAMEAAAYVAGEPHSDHPQCASTVITAFVIEWNDRLGNDRNRLIKPLIPRVVGTRSTRKIEEARGYLALDWFLRVMTPAWLDLVEELQPHAATMRAAAPVVDLASARTFAPAAAAVRAAAWDAAWAAGAAATDAVRTAAWAAVTDAVRAAAGDAARAAAIAAVTDAVRAAATDLVRAAAGDAARAAASAAASAAAWDALRSTVERLQQSAVDLLERMIGLGGAA
jgi:hypothetical protein